MIDNQSIFLTLLLFRKSINHPMFPIHMNNYSNHNYLIILNVFSFGIIILVGSDYKLLSSVHDKLQGLCLVIGDVDGVTDLFLLLDSSCGGEGKKEE